MKIQTETDDCLKAVEIFASRISSGTPYRLNVTVMPARDEDGIRWEIGCRRDVEISWTRSHEDEQGEAESILSRDDWADEPEEEEIEPAMAPRHYLRCLRSVAENPDIARMMLSEADRDGRPEKKRARKRLFGGRTPDSGALKLHV